MMKTTYLKLLRVVMLVMSCMIVTVAGNNLFGQSIERSAANKEARKFRNEAGFERINFSKTTLLKVLDNAEAIAIYNGVQGRSSRNAVLMIIGLNADGSQIGDTFQQGDENGLQAELSRAVKERQVASAKAHRRITAFSTTFGTADIMRLLDSPGVEGIDFLPTKSMDSSGNEILTLIASPVGNSPAIMQMPSFRSPCPPECFEDDGEN